MRAVVTGMIATYPVGGMAWDYGQYLIGLQRLGFEVFYLEDTGIESYHQNSVGYLVACLESLCPEVGQRWHYRPPSGAGAGIDEREAREIIATADLFLNVSGGCLMRDAYMRSSRKVLIDTDPGLNHFVNYPKWDRNPGWQGTHGFRGHDFFFTYAENMGKPQCNLPDLGLNWQPTRPLVVMDCWKPVPPGNRWTTVMSWAPYRHYQQAIEYGGHAYGAKEVEFERIEELPLHVKTEFEVAVGGKEAPHDRWRQKGWRTIDADSVSSTPSKYRDYIQTSRAEFSVAKNVYVKTNCGWFSTRSVCYLAAGRPVVLQDTGFSEIIATGDGIFSFSDLESAAAAIAAVEANYSLQQRAARDAAARYFSHEVVLQDLLNRIGLG